MRDQFLMVQFIGSLIVCTATFVSAMVMFAALNALGTLRVSKQGELVGLDIEQHGTSAYPEIRALPHFDVDAPIGIARGPDASRRLIL
jgi:ammonia channel protein AmtB